MTGGGKSALCPSRPRPFVPRMKNDDFSNFHLFINLQQAQPAHRTAGPGSKATIFCGRALRSRTVFTEIIISTFLPVALLLSCLPVRLITIFPLFVLCFHRFPDCQQKRFLTSFGNVSLFQLGIQKIVGNLLLVFCVTKPSCI